MSFEDDITLEDIKRAGEIAAILEKQKELPALDAKAIERLGFQGTQTADLEPEEKVAMSKLIAAAVMKMAIDERLRRSKTPDNELLSKARQTIDEFTLAQPGRRH